MDKNINHLECNRNLSGKIFIILKFNDSNFFFLMKLKIKKIEIVLRWVILYI